MGKHEKIDLHLHTTASDGIKTPQEIVKLAIDAGLKAIAIADHDNTRGIAAAQKAAQKYQGKAKIEVIPGIEVEAHDPAKGIHTLHVIGLFIDPDHKAIQKHTKFMEQDRILQKKRMITKLNDLGYDITFKEVEAKAPSPVIGRPHVARVLVEKYPDKFKDIRQVFDTLIGEDQPAYVPHDKQTTIPEAVKLMHDAGGIAILAHPAFHYNFWPELFKLFVQAGGDGVETMYSYEYNRAMFDKKQSAKINSEAKKLAKKFGLVESGGSDYHAPGKGAALGEVDVPVNILDKLKERLQSREK